MKQLLYIILIALMHPTMTFSQSHRSRKLKDITHIELKGNNLIRNDTVIIQINERMGDHDANASILYQKGDKASFGDIWVEDMEGNIIRKLKKNEIKDRPRIMNSTLYSDHFIKYFEVKHNQYPYKLFYTTNTQEKKYIDIAYFDYTNSKIPVNEGKLTISCPIEKKIKYQYSNIDSYKIDTLGNTAYHQWHFSHTPDLHQQIYSAVNSNSAPRINVSSPTFKYGINGENINWDTYGNWVFRLNADRDKLPIGDQQNIERLISGISDERDKINTLYHYLQDNTRYINISTREGGHQAYPAEYVSANKYGDCKALTNYMQAMLKHIDIKSFYTLIYSDDKVRDIEDDYSYNAFNHVILSIPTQKDTIYLECTSNNDPIGYVSTNNQGRKALLIQEKGSKLINIPKLAPDDVLCTKNIVVTLKENGEADISIKAKELGESYELANYLKSSINKNRTDIYIRNSILDGAYEILDYNIIKEDRENASININVEAKMKNVHKLYGNNLAISALSMNIPSFEKPGIRTQDVQFSYPINRQEKITYKINHKKIENIPENILITSAWGDKYSVEYNEEGNILTVNKSLLITAKRIDISNYEEFYSFILKVRNNEISNIYLETL